MNTTRILIPPANVESAGLTHPGSQGLATELSSRIFLRDMFYLVPWDGNLINLVGRCPYQGVGHPVTCAPGLSRVGCLGEIINRVIGAQRGLVARGHFIDAGAVMALHFHIDDVHVAALADVVALKHRVREHAVAAHHGSLVCLGVHHLPHGVLRVIATFTCT